MILLATVVLPDALPPQRPAAEEEGGGSPRKNECFSCSALVPELCRSVFIHQTQTEAPYLIDSDIKGCSPITKASLKVVPVTLYQGGLPAV